MTAAQTQRVERLIGNLHPLFAHLHHAVTNIKDTLIHQPDRPHRSVKQMQHHFESEMPGVREQLFQQLQQNTSPNFDTPSM